MPSPEKTKQRMFVLQGLPGSGKSTTAKVMLHADKTIFRVNKDTIRSMLYFYDKQEGNIDFSFEKLVEEIENAAIRAILASGSSVIVDDVNLGQKTYRRLTKLADDLGVEIFPLPVKTPVNVCIERDAARKDTEGSVGEHVIRSMANTFRMA